eukprot:GGOE01001384.1.p1 GENE.GGOE01001384.1~~GGOE01001384.1.p1  ORF type:complete len:824 (-),score=244.39 GGOE01001384.1:360-2831(-)
MVKPSLPPEALDVQQCIAESFPDAALNLSPHSGRLSLQESRDSRKLAKLAGEGELPQRLWTGWAISPTHVAATVPCVLKPNDKPRACSAPSRPHSCPTSLCPSTAMTEGHRRRRSPPLVQRTTWRPPSGSKSSDSLRRDEAAHPSAVLEVERLQRKALQKRLKEAERSVQECAYLRQKLQSTQHLLESETERRHTVEQRLKRVHLEEPRTGMKGAALLLVHQAIQANLPDPTAAAVVPPGQADLETLWAQLEAERSLRRRLQQRLSLAETAVAETEVLRRELHRLREALRPNGIAHAFQPRHPGPSEATRRPAMCDCTTQTVEAERTMTTTWCQTDAAPRDVPPAPPTGSDSSEGTFLQLRLRAQEEDLKRKDGIIAQMDDIVRQGDAVRQKLHSTLDELSQTVKERNATIKQMDDVVRKGEAVRRRLRTVIDALNTTIQEQAATIQALEGAVQESESSRRVLHHHLQELKGNIRVFCRVRPPLEGEAADLAHFAYPGAPVHSRTLAIVTPQGAGAGHTKRLQFTFDRVFGPQATQAEVFAEISLLVRSALDGCRVCIFAYGQTGSGKTYTMQGPNVDLHCNVERRGIIPQALEQILQCRRQRPSGWQYTLEVTCLEIYNERLRDLLGGDDSVKLQVKHLPDSRTAVLNITVVPVEEEDALLDILERAARNRATAATCHNEQSSRSHFVFSLHITGHSPCGQLVTHGVLNIVDLAGSERLAVSPADPERLKEVQCINKSLSCLRDVIGALAQRTPPHVPYRNSKLTYLLQNSLGKGAKVLMFVNVSPLSEHLAETVCSLRFANQVSTCELGSPHRAVEEPAPD